ncbi:hypothetical protein F2Q70_00020175 [Brassica cretica]|uniref:Uncharacterized protein n=1 Tax=Brassica cretica TaxID=69181 RepID=A0A8S9GQG6_BRACR|nr:hypothetical protein F2Q70_00020175 [Brassica cretica]
MAYQVRDLPCSINISTAVGLSLRSCTTSKNRSLSSRTVCQAVLVAPALLYTVV